jgi:hypothetical protein
VQGCQTLSVITDGEQMFYLYRSSKARLFCLLVNINVDFKKANVRRIIASF